MTARQHLQVHPQDVLVGDIVWAKDGKEVIKVQVLSASTAITARHGVGGSIQWLLEAWRWVAVWRTVPMIQCETFVMAHRSTGSLRRDHEYGYDQTRQCRSRASYRMTGGGRVEHLCTRHARLLDLTPGAPRGWVEGIERIAKS